MNVPSDLWNSPMSCQVSGKVNHMILDPTSKTVSPFILAGVSIVKSVDNVTCAPASSAIRYCW